MKLNGAENTKDQNPSRIFFPFKDFRKSSADCCRLLAENGYKFGELRKRAPNTLRVFGSGL